MKSVIAPKASSLLTSAVVALMAVGELFAYPALKIRDVACKIHLAPR